MSSTLNFWDTFWIRRVPPHALACTRVAVGLYLLVYAGLYVPHLSMIFSNEGLVLPLYVDRFPALSLILLRLQSISSMQGIYSASLVLLWGCGFVFLYLERY